MTRLPNWRQRLAIYIEVVRTQPFKFGHFDCSLFAAGAVDAQAGSDFYETFSGQYDDMASGLAKAKERGFDSHVAMVKTYLRRVSPPLAAMGDVAVLNVTDGPALGVVQGAEVFLVGKEGLMLAPFNKIRMAFTI